MKPIRSRREFVKLGLASAYGAATGVHFFGCRTAYASEKVQASAEQPNDHQLVCIFLRGGVDGLNVVVPHAEDGYYKARPQIAVPAPGKGADRALWLDDRFGLHPALSALHPLYQEGKLCFLHAVGSPHPSRSHFDAQDYMESGTPGEASTRDGWLNRCIHALGLSQSSPLTGVALSPVLPRALHGKAPAIAMRDVRSFGLRAPKRIRERLKEGFSNLYDESGDPLSHPGREALRAVSDVHRALGNAYTPEGGAQYPRAARQLIDVARLLKSDLGVRVAWVDAAGWDTHAGQGGATGQLANRLRVLGDSLGAFEKDMGDRMRKVVVVVMSEFGRTVAQNGTGGTDHGRGGAMLALGGGIKGGRVLARWPGLNETQLYEGRDLAVTTDFRAVLTEVLTNHLNVQNTAEVFPGYALGSAKLPGLFSA